MSVFRTVMVVAVVAIMAVAVSLAGCGGRADDAPVLAPVTDPVPAAQNSATRARGGVTYIPNCLGEPVQEPREYVLTCADAGYLVAGLRWEGWGTARAVATGVAHVETCVPDCATGSVEQYPATVVVDRIREGESAAYYTRMVVEADDAASAGLPTRDVYLLRDGISAKPPGPLAR